jgi:hypothetical protein
LALRLIIEALFRRRRIDGGQVTFSVFVLREVRGKWREPEGLDAASVDSGQFNHDGVM